MHSWETQGRPKHLHRGEVARRGMLSLDLEGCVLSRAFMKRSCKQCPELQQPELSCPVAAHL